MKGFLTFTSLHFIVPQVIRVGGMSSSTPPARAHRVPRRRFLLELVVLAYCMSSSLIGARCFASLTRFASTGGAREAVWAEPWAPSGPAGALVAAQRASQQPPPPDRAFGL